jgi:hypothetical protein
MISCVCSASGAHHRNQKHNRTCRETLFSTMVASCRRKISHVMLEARSRVCSLFDDNEEHRCAEHEEASKTPDPFDPSRRAACAPSPLRTHVIRRLGLPPSCVRTRLPLLSGYLPGIVTQQKTSVGMVRHKRTVVRPPPAPRRVRKLSPLLRFRRTTSRIRSSKRVGLCYPERQGSPQTGFKSCSAASS